MQCNTKKSVFGAIGVAGALLAVTAFAQTTPYGTSAAAALPGGNPQQNVVQMPKPVELPTPKPMSVDEYYAGKLNPKEIEKVKDKEINREEASARVTISGHVVAKKISLSLQSNNTPYDIRIAQGYGSSIVFVDATGMPWPIRRVDNFNTNALGLLGFEEKSKDCKTDSVNSFSVYAKSRFDNGVINVFLCDAPVPVVFNFKTDAKAKDVDNPVEVRITTKGSMAKAEPVVVDGRPTYNALLLSILDGQIPAVATPLISGHAGVSAWTLEASSDKNGNVRTILKTPMTLFSPAPIESRSGANGVSAYLIPATPVVLLSDQSGRVVSVVLMDK